MSEVERAKQIAQMVRNTHPEIAAEIDRRIAEFTEGNLEELGIEVGITYKLEKFDGEYEPGKQPVEVLTGTG